MFATTEQIQTGVIKYIDTEVGAKATGMTKFWVYFTTPSIHAMVAQKLNEFKDNTLFSDLFDNKGCLNLEATKQRAEEAIKKAGGKVLLTQFNYYIDTTDIEKLYQLIKES